MAGPLAVTGAKHTELVEFPLATANMTLRPPVGMRIQSVEVDNNANTSLFIQELSRFVPPTTTGWVGQCDGLSQLTVSFQSPPGVTQQASVSGQVATVIMHADPLPPAAGVAYEVSISAIVSVASQLAEVQIHTNSGWNNVGTGPGDLSMPVNATVVGGTVAVTQPVAVVGKDADGAPPTGSPVLMAGQDGTDVQSLHTDTSGNPIVVGAAANGAPVAANPVLIAGSDGTDARTLATDASGNLKIVTPAGQVVTTQLSNSSYTDRSGTITSGGTAQQLCASNSTRKKLYVINTDDTGTSESLWINFTTTAVRAHPSIELKVGAQWAEDASACSNEAVSVIATTTGHAWTAKEM